MTTENPPRAMMATRGQHDGAADDARAECARLRPWPQLSQPAGGRPVATWARAPGRQRKFRRGWRSKRACAGRRRLRAAICRTRWLHPWPAWPSLTRTASAGAAWSRRCCLQQPQLNSLGPMPMAMATYVIAVGSELQGARHVWQRRSASLQSVLGGLGGGFYALRFPALATVSYTSRPAVVVLSMRIPILNWCRRRRDGAYSVLINLMSPSRQRIANLIRNKEM